MSFQLLSTLLFCLITTSVGQKQWALLVAGSSGYSNYRHQADVCHSYHVVHNHGIPDERIIVMMYDDIANNPFNPFKGNIINQPNGPNVYPGVPKDYTGKEITSDTFLKVLKGDSEGINKTLGKNGKVINSGPDDRIFVFFADHGGPGFLCFPQDDDVLHAEDLHKTIKDMYTNKRYKQMVFYVEACHSGSMFNKILEKNINVFATTAANPHESSSACYHDAKRDTWLGDFYSVNWMQDSDKTIGKLPVADFQGSSKSNRSISAPNMEHNFTIDAVPSEDVAMYILIRKLEMASGVEKIRHRAALEALMKRKQDTEEFFKNVVGLVTMPYFYDIYLRTPVSFSDFKCYKESLRLIMEMCPGMRMAQNDYAMRPLFVVANLCETDIHPEKIWSAIGKASYESSICS